ncbi:MAG: sulfatase-like hydrolase/transferase [Acidobacteria bacterium]|nr:sulfatase-like hydrolase/transferase [Acidobacteriota bacterium]
MARSQSPVKGRPLPACSQPRPVGRGRGGVLPCLRRTAAAGRRQLAHSHRLLPAPRRYSPRSPHGTPGNGLRVGRFGRQSSGAGGGVHPEQSHPALCRLVPGADSAPSRRAPGWRDYPRYYAALSEADAALGRLVGVLEETRLAADTILLFTSHCGEMLGSHGLTGADEFYEESAAVPLFLRYPRRLKAGGVVEFPLSLTDLAPTLLALCGAGLPRSLHGRNLAPLLLGAPGVRPESVFVEGRLGAAGGWRMLIRGVSKLVVDLRHQVTALYNLGLDPFETENQATPRAQELTRAEMMAILRDWMSRTGDWAERPR